MVPLCGSEDTDELLRPASIWFFLVTDENSKQWEKIALGYDANLQ